MTILVAMYAGLDWGAGWGGAVKTTEPNPSACAHAFVDCGLPCILHACISSAEVRAVVDSLREEFPGSSYNIITRNCNTFSNELARLLLDKPVPGYINRLANMGSFMSCLLPRSLTGAAPVEGEGAAAGGRAGAGGGASARRCVLACLRACVLASHAFQVTTQGRAP